MNNRDLIAGNLEEAIEQLQETVNELRKNSELTEVDFQLQLEHAYHHINFAWHIRNATDNDAIECSEKNFARWSKFPVGEIDEYE